MNVAIRMNSLLISPSHNEIGSGQLYIIIASDICHMTAEERGNAGNNLQKFLWLFCFIYRIGNKFRIPISCTTIRGQSPAFSGKESLVLCKIASSGCVQLLLFVVVVVIQSSDIRRNGS